MAKVKVIALKSHSPDGINRYETGKDYRTSPSAAKVLVALGFVRIDTAPVEEVTTVAPESKADRMQRKEYKRRDMRPEE